MELIKIKNRWLHAGMSIFILATVFSPLGCAEKDLAGGPVCRGLQYRLATSRQEYSIGETVVLTAYIRNLSDEQIIIPANPDEGETTFLYEGREAFTDKVTFTEDKRMPLVVPAGAEVRYMMSEYDRSYFKKPGKWKVRVLHVFRQIENCPGPHWTGTLASNKLELIILKDD